MGDDPLGIHDGHRRRLRQRFLTYGMDSLEDHEVLEYLLFFALARGDTNELAHSLISRFGSLSGVLDASFSDLVSVKGIGEHTAYLIMTAKPLCRRYMLAQNSNTQPLDSVDMCAKYLSSYYFGAKEEHAYLLCLDAKCRPICCRELSSGSPTATELPIRKAAQMALDMKAAAVILSHNHPGGDAVPSPDDRAMTRAFRDTLQSLGIKLIDHIVFGGNDFVSMAQDGFMY